MSVPYVDSFMQVALDEAATALREGEVPVGCVFVSLAANAAAHQRHNNNTTTTTTTAAAAMASAEVAVAARGRNHTNELRHALAHAEFMAAQQLLEDEAATAAAAAAVAVLSCVDTLSPSSSACPPHGVAGLPSLSSYVLYVTVEPCVMCGAMLLYNQIGHVFFGCRNPRFGGNGTVLALHRVPACNKRPRCDGEAVSAEASGGAPSLVLDAVGSPHTAASALPGSGAPEHATPRDGQQRDMKEAEARVSESLAAVSSPSLSPPPSLSWWPGYGSEGGYREAEAIALLQRFYERENPNAPGHKRKVKAAV